MKKEQLIEAICEHILNNLFESGWYDQSATPHHSKSDIHRNIGRNPLYVDNGGHASSDQVRQVSTIDYNGANFQGERYIFPSNKFTLYKMKNFGRDTVKGTRQFFSDITEMRRAIDTVFGAAQRNRKNAKFRFITSEEFADKKDSILTNTFCEFSFDNGATWYILLPRPVQTMRQSKL